MISFWGGNTRDLESYCSEPFVERLLVFISVPLSVNNVFLEREFSQFMDGIEMYIFLEIIVKFQSNLKTNRTERMKRDSLDFSILNSKASNGR